MFDELINSKSTCFTELRFGSWLALLSLLGHSWAKFSCNSKGNTKCYDAMQNNLVKFKLQTNTKYVIVIRWWCFLFLRSKEKKKLMIKVAAICLYVSSQGHHKIQNG